MFLPIKSSYFFLSFLLLINFAVLSVSKEDNHDHLSKHQHHDDSDNHNPAFDHEAFLGEESKSFSNLGSEESRQRLGSLVDKIDANADGKVSYEELKDWIHKSQKNYIMEDVERQWKTHKQDQDDGHISWNDYKSITYGFMNDLEPGMKEDDLDFKTYKDMMRRDEKRWNAADRNGDKLLDKSEFADFLHPEESEIMRDVVIEETLEDVDKDKDGRISLSEYIADMYSDTSSDSVPDWVVKEREQFNEVRDKNKDGYLDRDEVADWIIPQDYDHSGAEAKHLIEESDEDKDGFLTKEEIVNSYELFVGSQATDYGEALTQTQHDEL